MDILKGIVTALVVSFLAALLFAYIFRVPIPLVGMIGPLGAIGTYSTGFFDVLQSIFAAWMFYGIFGGFIILPLFGGFAGYLAGHKFSGKPGKFRMVLVYSAIAGVVPVLFLSTLDYVIGSW